MLAHRRASSSAGVLLRRFCRVRGIPLPYRPDPRDGSKGPGLAAALQALGASAEHAAALAPRALASHRDMQLLAEVDAQEIARLKAHCGLQLG